MKTTIGEKIAQLRKAKGLTQEQLGEALGITGQAVSKWEKGESMPDILLLPDLCGLLSVSVDTLLDVPDAMRKENIVREFCEYARENGRSAILLDALSRLLNDAGRKEDASWLDFGPDFLRVYDSAGLGFVAGGADSLEKCLRQSPEHISYILRPLAEEKIIAILGCTSVDQAVTREEIAAATGLGEDDINRYLLALMKRKVLEVDTDNKGKQGYVQSTAMAGVYMILAGCLALSAEGACNGLTRFTRMPKLMS
jgi:transcriptional regulator with XRE-family HTH domain